MVNFTCSITLSDKDYRDYSEYAESQGKTVPDLVREAVKADVVRIRGLRKLEKDLEKIEATEESVPFEQAAKELGIKLEKKE